MTGQKIIDGLQEAVAHAKSLPRTPKYVITLALTTDGTEANGKEPIARLRKLLDAVPWLRRVRITRVDTDK